MAPMLENAMSKRLKDQVTGFLKEEISPGDERAFSRMNKKECCSLLLCTCPVKLAKTR